MARTGVACASDALNGPVDRPWGVRTVRFEDPGGHVRELAH